jgi:hypothetical protein
MDEAVNRRLLTAVTRFRSEAHLCGVCGGQSDTGAGFFFSPSISDFPCQYHSTSVLYVTYMRLPWMLCNINGNIKGNCLPITYNRDTKGE